MSRNQRADRRLDNRRRRGDAVAALDDDCREGIGMTDVVDKADKPRGRLLILPHLGGTGLGAEAQPGKADAAVGVALGGALHQLLDARGGSGRDHLDVLSFIDGDIQLVNQIAVIGHDER